MWRHKENKSKPIQFVLNYYYIDNLVSPVQVLSEFGQRIEYGWI